MPERHRSEVAVMQELKRATQGNSGGNSGKGLLH